MPESSVALMQQLHDEHAAALWGYCLRLTGQDRARAEDVVQETLLRAWRNHDRLDESRGSVRSWLFTVARNIVIDEWRTSRSQHEVAVPEVPEGRDEVDHTDQLLDVVAGRRGRDVAVRRPPGRAARVLLPRGVGRAGGAPARHPRGNGEVAHPLRSASTTTGVAGDGGRRMTCRFAHLDGAYVLGSLSPAERLEFETHLPGLRRVQPCGARARRAARAARPGRRRRPRGADARRPAAADAPARPGARGAR